ncbi:GNAT family N-acetyltransferase [Methanoplanus limicola]|uniref:BioF2-like acetyltransferase domain-containing protein n=1 Tax=Methanoplanus limicola DSM 2279 TaxID=937775 RepID=H1YZS1_9EURY|nr:GNAT family N-acetyltransferase [Methanoplanus limicola]EHQ34333.1 hypothetical protein Metlim_0180 [Methanoplanus limicola DSM 2279]
MTNNPYNIRIADEDDATEWDKIVEVSDQATIFHRWKWLKICEKHSDFSLAPLICYNNIEPIAVYPLFFLKKAGLKMVFSPPPHLGLLYLGPAFLNSESLKQNRKESYYTGTQKAVDNYIKTEIKANYINFSLSPHCSDPRAFKWQGYEIEPNYDYIFDLKSGMDKLWKNMKKNTRMEINKTKKMGLTIEIGGQEDIDTLHRLVTERYGEQNRNANIPKEFLIDIYSNFRENTRILVAKYNGEVLTANIKLKFKNEELSWIGSPKPKNFTPSPNMLITWEEMQDAYDNGMDYYVQMGIAGNKRLHTFFSKFNPDLRIRFNAKKTTPATGLLESGYKKILKPAFEKYRS